ncbi:MAG: 6-phosphogluconate dehydrogenase (decarboxylating) [Zetaproteobacteria bacterium CG12_big_fil_rev_8_21_14_0_65_54_13]|nr:MAG: 6-phosphogluconate dehydrogenase (decarboxylating) [Zetaproteobacteria bacterium CG12_big_fil_rev_8_21_14_0_65_54_13]PIX55667.1 MAG: 6-phosphogluconate dehydrogenase (decarboxylating) [Zetaproteobacteria bacterium CG_4_10_14_3_um_filter_54_28]PJA30279.1 MAG: 6-phosphogluconate dehydrogenase (decarboxylating) [Zetaproteobacteria bacterium CG_4_9_14_3_um_filter_54_145]
MKLAMIGLGRMGGNMVKRLAGGGHEVVAYDLDSAPGAVLAAEFATVTAAENLQDVIAQLPAPRVIWVMVPHQFVDSTIAALLQAGVESGDLIIDGGNSNYKEGQRRGRELAEQGILFADCGTSGGVWGLQNGYSLMIGGTDTAIALIAPALTTLASNDGKGWGHVGPVGSGHFVKMVHNGIEYGMMQAFAEGFELMQAKEEFDLDMHQISRVWQHGSVVSSWLLDLTGDALEQDGDLSSMSDWMDDSGEGRWTVNESIDLGIPTPVLTLALQMRFRSRQKDAFAGKIVNAQRAGFGGHAIKAATTDSE